MLRSRLIWKLLGIVAWVIALLIALVWLAIDYLAARSVSGCGRVGGSQEFIATEGIA